MQLKKPSKTWDDVPHIITPKDYAEVVGVGENTARETFNRTDFPRIKGTGVKQLADKEAVIYWIKGLDIQTAIVNRIIQEINGGNDTNDRTN